jgi:hypothetical protein
MGGVNVEHFTRHGIDPATGETLARKNQRMNAVIVDDSELYIKFERSFDRQPPHRRALPQRFIGLTGCEVSFRHAIPPACLASISCLWPSNEPAMRWHCDKTAITRLVCGDRSDRLLASLIRVKDQVAIRTNVLIIQLPHMAT